MAKTYKLKYSRTGKSYKVTVIRSTGSVGSVQELNINTNRLREFTSPNSTNNLNNLIVNEEKNRLEDEQKSDNNSNNMLTDNYHLSTNQQPISYTSSENFDSIVFNDAFIEKFCILLHHHIVTSYNPVLEQDFHDAFTNILFQSSNTDLNNLQSYVVQLIKIYQNFKEMNYEKIPYNNTNQVDQCLSTIFRRYITNKMYVQFCTFINRKSNVISM